MTAFAGGLFWRARITRPRSFGLFSSLPRRPPGESLRLELEKAQEEFAATGSLALAITFIGTGLLAGDIHSWVVVVPIGLFAYGWCTRNLYRSAAATEKLKLAFQGKRAVAEELNQLLRHGFHVLHDVPMESFDLDHVVVGPSGIFLVETTTRRPSDDMAERPKPTVIFDGGALWFPKYTERGAIERAARHAEALTAWLRQATDEGLTVRPVVTLPGWWVDQKARGEVMVLNPEDVRTALSARTLNPLSAGKIQQLASLLAEKRRIEGK